MSNMRVLKRGEFLFKESDKVQTVFIIQSGQLSIQFLKNRKNTEIMTVSAGYVFADQIVLSSAQYTYSAMANQETKVVEIPIEAFKSQYESFHQIYKSFIKTSCERLKWAMVEIKNKKSEKDMVACSVEEVPRAFGYFYHSMKHKGVIENSSCRVDWAMLRQYSQRIFGESLKRTEQVTQILVKLKLGEYIMTEVDEDDVLAKPEISAFKIYDLLALESFIEFYQYYYYKGNKQNLLRPDEVNYNVLNLLLLSFENCEADKAGIVSRDLNEVTDFFKDYGISFGSGQLSSLESIGLFCKRKSMANNQVLLQFELKEFRQLFDSWRILREVEKWNDHNMVDIYEKEEPPKKKLMVSGGTACAACNHVMVSVAKFCSECGHRMDLLEANTNLEKRAA
jgi:hypothetical protein